MRKLHLLFLFTTAFMLTATVYSQQVQVKDYRNADGILIAKKLIEDPSLAQKWKVYEDPGEILRRFAGDQPGIVSR